MSVQRLDLLMMLWVQTLVVGPKHFIGGLELFGSKIACLFLLYFTPVCILFDPETQSLPKMSFRRIAVEEALLQILNWNSDVEETILET